MRDVYHVKNEGYLLDVFYDEFFNRTLSVYILSGLNVSYVCLKVLIAELKRK